MTSIMLSAGRATRLGGGCKAMKLVGGRTMHEWWRRTHLDKPTVVCRSEDAASIPGPSIVCDEGGGPAFALRAALALVAEPVTVVYADTWVPAVPHEDEFCGVAAARGPRSWDVVEDGLVAYRHVDADEAALVAIGLYRFADVERLGKCVDEAINGRTIGAEVGLADVVNLYGLPFVPVVGWQDVGDPQALARWRHL